MREKSNMEQKTLFQQTTEGVDFLINTLHSTDRKKIKLRNPKGDIFLIFTKNGDYHVKFCLHSIKIMSFQIKVR